MTNEQEILKAYFSKLGKRSAEKMTPEQRKERAQKAIQSRWNKDRT